MLLVSRLTKDMVALGDSDKCGNVQQYKCLNTDFGSSCMLTQVLSCSDVPGRRHILQTA